MEEKDAYQLLFKHDFGNGSLFKNQGDLATELINNQLSSYYTAQSEIGYSNKLGNLKVYVSQLFSENTRRSITPEFKKSLQAIIAQKIPGNDTEKEEIIDSVFRNLAQRNTLNKPEANKGKDSDSLFADFFSQLANAEYLTIFSAREIKLHKTTSFTDLLLDGLIKSLREGGHNKWYRFNFPVAQTCALFWMGLRKEIIKYLHINKIFLPSAVSQLHSNKIISFKSMDDLKNYPNIESRISSEVLDHLSKNRIISVFHLKEPVYLMPFIAVNPNDRGTRSVFSIYQSETGDDMIHKFTKDELFHWSFFVWDNLRSNKFGKPVEYSDSFTD